MFKESRLRIEFAQFTVEVKANLQSFNNPNDVKEIVEYVVFERNLLDPHVSLQKCTHMISAIFSNCRNH